MEEEEEDALGCESKDEVDGEVVVVKAVGDDVDEFFCDESLCFSSSCSSSFLFCSMRFRIFSSLASLSLEPRRPAATLRASNAAGDVEAVARAEAGGRRRDENVDATVGE